MRRHGFNLKMEYGSITIVRLIIGVLGGSWVVISGVISPLRWVISIVTLYTYNPTSNCH